MFPGSGHDLDLGHGCSHHYLVVVIEISKKDNIVNIGHKFLKLESINLCYFCEKKKKKNVCFTKKTTSGHDLDLGRVRGPSHGLDLDRVVLVTTLVLVAVVVIAI